MTGQHFAIFDTAIGPCGIVWGERGITGVQLPMGNEEKTRKRIHQRNGDVTEAAPPAEVQRAIEGMMELLAGKPNDLADIVLDLDGVKRIQPRRLRHRAQDSAGPDHDLWRYRQKTGRCRTVRATSARRSATTRVRSWCPVTACWRPATSRAVFRPMAAW